MASRVPTVLVVALAACGPVIDGSADASGNGTGTSTSTATTSVSASVSDATTITASESTTPPDPPVDTAEDSGFVETPDASVFPGGCSLWEQNCPRGQKCTAYSSNGASEFDATRCVDVVRDPRGVGESCNAFDQRAGQDDCELGTICWHVDPDTLVGECVGFCEGTETEPSCDDPCADCVISGATVLALCLSACDPIAQDCDEGSACYPVNDTFVCAPDAGADEGAIGSTCEFINVCDPGNFCAPAENLPACDGTGCCAPYCDVGANDGCDALLPGTVCRPWFEDLPAPSCVDFERVGGCLAP